MWGSNCKFKFALKNKIYINNVGEAIVNLSSRLKLLKNKIYINNV